jgi:DNA-binding LacI/PurR family transcriptional regulator
METFNAVRAAVNRLDVGIDLTISHLGRSMERKERETIDLLARKPDAVIVTYPPFVYFVEKAIVSLGIRVPDETLVVSVVEDDYSEYVRIPVIAIRRRTAKLAEFALDALLAKIRFRSSPTDLDLASELIVPPEIQSYLDESGGGMLKKFRTVAVSGLT